MTIQTFNKKVISTLVLGALVSANAFAGSISLPTGPFIDTTLHDGARNGAVGTLSTDGRYAVYDIDNSYTGADGTNIAVRDVVVFDKQLGSLTQITFGNNDSYSATISGDGRYVAFLSEASDFSSRNKSISVADIGFITNPGPHVYVADIRTDLGHALMPSTYTMVDTSALDALADCRAAFPANPACSGGDGPANGPFISQDGSTVAYTSSALNIDGNVHGTDASDKIYVWDRISKVNTSVTPWFNGRSDSPTLSADASRLAFVSTATDVATAVRGIDVAGGNVLLWHRDSGLFDLVSANDSVAADAPSWSPAISADGRWVAFTTMADNLDANDTNAQPDVYTFDIATGKSYAVSVTRTLGGVCHDGSDQLGTWKPICLSTAFAPTGGSEPSISGDGRFVAFMSASPLINQIGDSGSCDAVDYNNRLDIYVADMANGGEVTLQTMLRDSTGKLWATPNGEVVFRPSVPTVQPSRSKLAMLLFT
jgi:Tol biopolymer transport system component